MNKSRDPQSTWVSIPSPGPASCLPVKRKEWAQHVVCLRAHEDETRLGLRIQHFRHRSDVRYLENALTDFLRAPICSEDAPQTFPTEGETGEERQRECQVQPPRGQHPRDAPCDHRYDEDKKPGYMARGTKGVELKDRAGHREEESRPYHYERRPSTAPGGVSKSKEREEGCGSRLIGTDHHGVKADHAEPHVTGAPDHVSVEPSLESGVCHGPRS